MYSNILWKFRTQKNFDQKENRQKKQARKEEPQMISKTTGTRITRNKHQLQHQHNKAVEKRKSFLMTTQRIWLFLRNSEQTVALPRLPEDDQLPQPNRLTKMMRTSKRRRHRPATLNHTKFSSTIRMQKKKERKPLTNNSATIDIRIIQINTSITTNYLSKQPQALLNAHASFPKGSAIS